MSKKTKKCFFICPIGKPNSNVRKRSDNVMKHLLIPVCSAKEYEVIRADKICSANKISADIVNHLENDELVIADLTGLNANVFYEIGYRRAKNLPIIHIAKTETILPFDTIDDRTQFYDLTDLNMVEDFKQRLVKVIESLQPAKAFETLDTSETTSESKMTKNDVKSILGIGEVKIIPIDNIGEAGIKIYWRNNSNNVIKSVTFYLLIPNIYNEPVTVLPCKLTGPIEPVSKCIKNYSKYYRANPLYYKTQDEKWEPLFLSTDNGYKKLSYTSYNSESGQHIKNYISEENYDKIAFQAKFDEIMHSSAAHSIKIISAKIEYMDGTIVNIDNDAIKYACF
ncbi:MAG: hypothetical protein NC395_07345 [Prevotella sp.]|nr:hypothetical protein [Prevotella sp.]